MTPRRLVVKGPTGQTTFSVDVMRGQVCVMVFDEPFLATGWLAPAQVEPLVALLRGAAREASGRGRRSGSEKQERER